MLYTLMRCIFFLLIFLLRPFNKKIRTFYKNRMKQNFNSLEGKYNWLHCASVGEVNLSEKFVRDLLEISKRKILLSVFTDDGIKIAKEKYKDENRIEIIYFPIDSKREITKILSRIDLKSLILVETEIWPNIINLVSQKSRVIVISGRISDKSFTKYKKIKFLIKKSLEKISMFYMQSTKDVERIIFLGANPDNVERVGNMKFDLDLEHYSDEEKEEYKKNLNLGDRLVFVAGSTRVGEEEIIIDAFKKMENTVLIIVPRHIERVKSIEALLESKAISFVKYSEINVQKTEKIDIIIVDKMGILRKLYAISDAAFVGGTLVNVGGHSLLEPLSYGKLPIFGPYTQNVKSIARDILDLGLGCRIESGSELPRAIEVVIEKEKNMKVQIDEFLKNNGNIGKKIIESEDIW